MEPIAGVDLARALKDADTAVAKIAQDRVTAHIRSLKIKQHSLRVKKLRLIGEIADLDAALVGLQKQLDAIAVGDWSLMDPLEFGEKPSNQ